MKKQLSVFTIGSACVSFALVALVASGCTPVSSQPEGAGGSGGNSTDTGGSGGKPTDTGGSGGKSTDTGGSGGKSTDTGGSGGKSTDTGGSGGTSSGGSGGTSTGGSGGSGGSGGTSTNTAGSGGTTTSTGGTTTSNGGTTGSTSTGPALTTVDLITAPDPCGPGHIATHDDAWMCILGTPANAMGAWYGFPWGGCANPKLSTAGGKVCFSGGPCTGAGGAGMGLSLCDIEAPINTWPQWQAVATAGNIPVGTGAQGTFGQCNKGAAITGITWTLTGSTPAGMSMEFHGPAAVKNTAGAVLGTPVAVAAGATSVTIPASVDGSKIASLQWSFPASTVTTAWNFCLTGIKLQYH